MRERIAIIGASDLQMPLILKAKEMDYETFVFAWAAGDPGEEAADHFYPISITETDRILNVCKEIHPAAVATIASDLAAIAVTKIANALGLPGNPPETAVIATNKFEMRKAFREAGLPTPEFVRVTEQENLNDIKKLRLPLIVKPTDRSGSRGIFKLTSYDEVEACVKQSCAESFEKKAIIEEYIEGDEYSCECISQQGVHHFLTVTKKFTTGAPHFIETGHMEPSGLSERMLEKVRDVVFQGLDALHVTTGASHSEFKILPDTEDIRLIEIGARMGGDCIGSDLVQLTTGIDFVENVIRAAAGLPLRLDIGEKYPYAAVRYVFGKNDYDHFQKTAEAGEVHIIRHSGFHFLENGEINDSSKRAGFYIVTGNTAEEVQTGAYLRE